MFSFNSCLSSIHRRLFAITNGKWNDLLTYLIRLKNGQKDEIAFQGLLGNESLADILQSLNEKGYYLCQSELNSSIVSSITDEAKTRPLRYVTKSESGVSYSKNKIRYEDSSLVDSPRFQFEASELIKIDPVRIIMLDKSLQKISQEYLGSTPYLDLVALWWSRACNNSSLSNFAAQKYHFDMDRIKFLKFFFYLTDVDEKNGPHCFVEGSHRELKKEFRGRGRFSDNKIAEIYGNKKVKKFTGKKGTILIADTRGLHKGQTLEAGERLLFQVQYTNSLFGRKYPKLPFSEIKDDRFKNDTFKGIIDFNR